MRNARGAAEKQRHSPGARLAERLHRIHDRLRLRLPELRARLLRLLLAAAEQRIEELLPVAHDEPQHVAFPAMLRQLFEKGRLHGIRLRLFNRVGGLQFRQPRPCRVDELRSSRTGAFFHHKFGLRHTGRDRVAGSLKLLPAETESGFAGNDCEVQALQKLDGEWTFGVGENQ